MITTEFLSKIVYKHDVKSYNTAFEYLFLKNQIIDILTHEKAEDCNTMLEELHFLEELLLDVDRQNYHSFTETELDEYQMQSDRAQSCILAFTSAKFITNAQSQYLLQCIAMSNLHPFNFAEFCLLSNVDPIIASARNIEIELYTDRTIKWELSTNKPLMNQ